MSAGGGARPRAVLPDWVSPGVHAAVLDEAARYRAALVEIAENRHGFSRPAGAIARAAIEGRELPGWE